MVVCLLKLTSCLISDITKEKLKYGRKKRNKVYNQKKNYQILSVNFAFYTRTHIIYQCMTMHIDEYTHIYTNIYMYKNINVYIYIRILTHTHVCVYIYICIYIYIYI